MNEENIGIFEITGDLVEKSLEATTLKGTTVRDRTVWVCMLDIHYSQVRQRPRKRVECRVIEPKQIEGENE